MATMTHPQKISLARSMRTQKELLDGVPLFETAAWQRRRYSRSQKELKKVGMDYQTRFKKQMDAAQKYWATLPWYTKIRLRIRAFIKRRFGI